MMGVEMWHFNITVGGVGMQRNLNLTPKQTSLGLPNRNSSPFSSQPPPAIKEGPVVWQDHGGLGNKESGPLGLWLTHCHPICTHQLELLPVMYTTAETSAEASP